MKDNGTVGSFFLGGGINYSYDSCNRWGNYGNTYLTCHALPFYIVDGLRSSPANRGMFLRKTCDIMGFPQPYIWYANVLDCFSVQSSSKFGKTNQQFQEHMTEIRRKWKNGKLTGLFCVTTVLKTLQVHLIHLFVSI